MNSFNIKFEIELGLVAFLALREIMILLIYFSVTGLRRNEVKFLFFKYFENFFFDFGILSNFFAIVPKKKTTSNKVLKKELTKLLKTLNMMEKSIGKYGL